LFASFHYAITSSIVFPPFISKTSMKSILRNVHATLTDDIE